MTPAEIQDLLRLTVGVPDSFSDLNPDTIDQLWMEGASVLANAAVPARLASSVSVSLSAGVDSYTVSGNPERVVSVNLDGAFLKPYNLEKLERESPGWASSTGTPDRYWLEGADADGSLKIRVYPKPSASSGTLVVSTISRPRPLSSYASSEVWQFSSVAQYALVFYMAWRWALTSRAMVAPEKASAWQSVWDKYLVSISVNEDPTSAMAQKATAERSFRLIQQ